MIRVVKSSNVPVILIIKGMHETTKNCGSYAANPIDYDTGVAKFNILSTVYGDKSVKDQLITDQHGKCCFCEADFTANGYGDVEHFRPKAGFTKTRTGTLVRPGYYWLAYEWENLLFSCQICNQRFKKNYFPLTNEANRAKNHTFDYRLENPLLINPVLNNPEDHITFNRHVPRAKTIQGKTTITGFGVDRPKLSEVREAYLQNVANNVALAKVNLDELTEQQRDQYSQIMKAPWSVIEDLIRKAKAFVNVAAKDSKPFAAMVRANFPGL